VTFRRYEYAALKDLMLQNIQNIQNKARPTQHQEKWILVVSAAPPSRRSFSFIAINNLEAS